MKPVLMTREYPPEIYGGAGVHVAHLAAALARTIDVEVRCFGAERAAPGPGSRLSVKAYGNPTAGPDAPRYLPTLQTISVNLAMAAGLDGATVVHSHTWYANLGGHAGKLAFRIPHVLT
ncbi:MAG TPA: glycosyltransferase, partial [Actinomycetota bacterium]|nr:glycosyltransferase [Actinomycetota bacterium]